MTVNETNFTNNMKQLDEKGISMDHKKTAHEILSAIGGKDNLASAAHCATRLRLVIADNSKIRKTEL